MKKCIAGLLLLAFAGSSWAEEIFACKTAHSFIASGEMLNKTTRVDETGEIMIRKNGKRVTYKDAHPSARLIEMRTTVGGDRSLTMGGLTSDAWTAATDVDQFLSIGIGSSNDGAPKYKFVFARLQFGTAYAQTGTCTKF